jgi:PAS domain S-box-containing protein
MITVNGKGSIIFWNPKAERMLGHTADDVLGQSV